MKSLSRLVSLALTLMVGGIAAGAQTPPATCPSTVPSGEELREPTELRAKDHRLSTTFTMELKQQCVPVLNTQSNTWSYQSQQLRTYVYTDPKTGKPAWGFPGPTLRIRKQEELQSTTGDRLKILLVNKLEPEKILHGKCDDACAGTGIDCSKISPLPTGAECAAAAGSATDPRILPGCCCLINQSQTWPDCFHGDNTTNLHLHGSHASPQLPQDDVLLEVRPKEGCDPAKDQPTHSRGVVACGQFQYDFDPPPPTQAEGTHWYHPHKHGSVSLQVANGMPGALIIEGRFDDRLRAYYGGKLVEKILIVQQIQAETNLYNDAIAPATTVNGQVSPTVTMKPGEVQRWRFINATMSVAAQVSVNFPPNVQARQIAMDGIRFSPENYATQPLFNPMDASQFDISPGNRADFLVEAPQKAGRYRMTYHLAGKSQVAGGKRKRLRQRDEALLKLEKQRPGDVKASEPALLTLVVEAAAAAPKSLATGFPPASKWPKMPWYLQNIPAKTDGEQKLTFEMTANSGDPTAKFEINGVQYNSNCANVTTKLNTTETFFVQNSSVLAHPYHIHINPFQVVEQGTVINGKPVAFVKYASPVWQDTVSVPAANNTGNGYALFRQRYLDFTGEYVLHCHFLGHEDRGMMFNVQTVCKDHPSKFGKSKPYGHPECVPGNLIPAAPFCPVTRASAAESGHSEAASGEQ